MNLVLRFGLGSDAQKSGEWRRKWKEMVL